MPLVPPYIASLTPYVPGRTPEQLGIANAIKLSSNENPLGPSPMAVAEMQKVLHNLHRYPAGGLRLRILLAEQFGLKVQNVITGSGSEGILANIIRTFLGDDDEVLTTEGGFIGIRVLVQSRGVPLRTVPYRDYHFDLEALASAITEQTKIIYLANPNNPTGTIFTKVEFDKFYRHVPERVLIILDEAYFEYARDHPRYPDSMSYRYDNVITLRTFSKAYGLAGVRIGYGFAHEDLISNLQKVKLPFEPSAVAEAAGIGALQDHEFLQRTLELNRQSLGMLREALDGCPVIPSHANFLMVLPPYPTSFTQALLDRGVIIRPLDSFGLPQAVRISTGTLEETERACMAIQEVREECR